MIKKINAEGGYMTVEATLILPMVLYVCISIVYIGFFQYDRCVMKQDAYRAALAGSSIYRENGQEVYNASFVMLENIGVQKYIATDCSQKITVQGRVNVSMKGVVKVPFQGIKSLTGVSGWEIKERAQSKCLNPVIFIRMCRQIKNNMDRKKETDEEKNYGADRIHE